MHIATVSLPVADQERARDFYTGVQGFGVRTDNPVPMGSWLEVAPSTSGPAFLSWGRPVTFADPDGNHLVVNQA